MPSDTRDVDDRSRALLLHDWDHCLHGGNCAEEIDIESIAARSHIHLGDRISHSAAGVIDPEIDAAKVVQRKTHNAINLLAVTHIAGKCKRAVGMTEAVAGGLSATCITRQQHDSRPAIRKNSCYRFANAHGGAGDNNHFP